MLSRRQVVHLIGSLPFIGAASGAKAQEGGFYYSGPPSDHFDGQRFFNPGGEPSRGFGDFLRWRLTKSAAPWPEPYPSLFKDAPPARVGQRDLRISFAGHASFLIQIAGHNILTDPIWSERASPVPFAGPRRYNPPGIPFDRLPKEITWVGKFQEGRRSATTPSSAPMIQPSPSRSWIGATASR